MGLYETRVVEGMPEKISSPRWPTKEQKKEGKILVILCENRIFLSIFAEYRGTC